jgi:hypothetical protein
MGMVCVQGWVLLLRAFDLKALLPLPKASTATAASHLRN